MSLVDRHTQYAISPAWQLCWQSLNRERVPVEWEIPMHYPLSRIPSYSRVKPYGIRVQRPYLGGIPVVRAKWVAPMSQK